MTAITQTCCYIVMRFDAQLLPRALELLLSASGPIHVKHGCRASRVESDLSDPAVVRYTEEWENNEAFKRNVQSTDFWRILLAMDLCAEEPQVHMGTFTGHTGIELLSNMRRGAGEPGSDLN